MKAFALCGAAAVSVSAAQSSAVLIGRGDSLLPFSFSGPGASSWNLSSDVTPWSGLPYLNISYDFSQGGWTASIGIASDAVDDLVIPQLQGLQFAIYNPLSHAVQISVEVEESDYSQTGTWPFIQPGWSNLSLPFNASAWLPVKPAFSYPLRGVSIGAQQSTGRNGWMGIADVALMSAAQPGSIPNPLSINLQLPAGVGGGTFVQGSMGGNPIQVGMEVVNRLDTPCTVDVTLQMLNGTGPMGTGDGSDGGWTTCASSTSSSPSPSLPGWSSLPFLCSLPADSPAGYVSFRALYNGSSCWTVNDTAASYEAAVAIVLPQPPVTPVTRNIRPNVFGGQMVDSAPAAAAIGMWTVRHGPLWRWNQPAECWNLSSCFDWSPYDGAFDLSAVGIEAMIDAREMAPPWAAASNTSGPTWASFPGPDHYEDYVHWMSVMLDRYGGMASSVEVSNEDDGLSYFMPQPIPLNETCIPLSLALINLTVSAMRQSANASGLKLVGMSSSSFDLKQEGNGGSTYAYYEKVMLNSPGVIQSLDAVSLHPYANAVWVPWVNQPWGNMSFMFPNETKTGTNSTVAQLMVTASLMSSAASAAGLADYKPILWPSEWGYNLMSAVPLYDGWATMHAALVAQGLVHMRSAPLAQYVRKALYFAAYDGCCQESGGFFGLWRPQTVRSPAHPVQPGDLPSLRSPIMPTPGVSAYATASVLLDVPSGRLPGMFVVDNTAEGQNVPPGQTSLPPSCVAFAPDTAVTPLPAPLVVLFITGHHYNDRTACNVTVTTGQPGALSLLSGLGTPLPLQVSAAAGQTRLHAADAAPAVVQLSIAPLPQYLVLPADADAEAVCASLQW